MFPELISGLGVLGAGWVVGRFDRWTNKLGERDESTSKCLTRLTVTVEHLNDTLGKLDDSIEKLWSLSQDHERRISHLEGLTHEPNPRMGNWPAVGAFPGRADREPDAHPEGR